MKLVVLSDIHGNEIAPYWTRITEWMLRGADSSHGSLLAQAMELCTRKCPAPTSASSVPTEKSGVPMKIILINYSSTSYSISSSL